MTTLGKLMRNTDHMKKIRDILINGKACPNVHFVDEIIDLEQNEENDENENEEKQTQQLRENESSELNWLIDQINVSEQTMIQKVMSEKDEYLIFQNLSWAVRQGLSGAGNMLDSES